MGGAIAPFASGCCGIRTTVPTRTNEGLFGLRTARAALPSSNLLVDHGYVAIETNSSHSCVSTYPRDAEVAPNDTIDWQRKLKRWPDSKNEPASTKRRQMDPIIPIVRKEPFGDPAWSFENSPTA